MIMTMMTLTIKITPVSWQKFDNNDDYQGNDDTFNEDGDGNGDDDHDDDDDDDDDDDANNSCLLAVHPSLTS